MFLSKILVDSHGLLVEIGLWLLFVVAAISGWSAGSFVGGGGLFGSIVSLIGAFVIAVLFVAPAVILFDVRNRVKAIEEIARARQ